jgi:5,6-dimethylbenzimidazole synthase
MEIENLHEFEPAHKEGVYQAIRLRRDVRGQFLPAPVPEAVLARVLNAAHLAPSVGFSQPWDFVLIKDLELRKAIHQAFLTANREAALMFTEAKREQYLGFKLEGILESPLNICVTYDASRFGPVVIGRTTSPQMGIFSCVCAVQNLWLAARAEGLGVGWVSIVHNREIRRVLNLPPGIVPAAYLCLGYVSRFADKPELEAAGWLPRVPLQEVVSVDGWGHACTDAWPALAEEIGRKESS